MDLIRQVDVGCAECKFLQRLKRLDFIRELVGVDVDKATLINSIRDQCYKTILPQLKAELC